MADVTAKPGLCWFLDRNGRNRMYIWNPPKSAQMNNVG